MKEKDLSRVVPTRPSLVDSYLLKTLISSLLGVCSTKLTLPKLGNIAIYMLCSQLDAEG